MELIILRLQAIQKSHNRLSKMLIKLQKARLKKIIDEEDVMAYRDSVIKRFEIAYDLTWKFLKFYFEYHLALTVNSPKGTFHVCLQQGLTTEEETRIFLNMIDDRNLTVHTYDEDLAEQVSMRIALYQQCMQELLTKIASRLDLKDVKHIADGSKRKVSRKRSSTFELV